MKVLIADDHPLYREALRGLLKQLDSEITVTEAGSFDEVLSLTSDLDLDLDLLLLDLRMPGMDWLIAVKELRARAPSVPIVVVSASNHAEDARQAILCGALGYIPKDSNSRIMLNALRLVLSGGIYVPPMMLDPTKGRSGGDLMAPGGDRREINRTVSLTPRQREVLVLISEGKPNKAIARTLGVSVPTVKLHVAAIFTALGVSNRTEAAITAREMGLTAPPGEA